MGLSNSKNRQKIVSLKNDFLDFKKDYSEIIYINYLAKFESLEFKLEYNELNVITNDVKGHCKKLEKELTDLIEKLQDLKRKWEENKGGKIIENYFAEIGLDLNDIKIKCDEKKINPDNVKKILPNLINDIKKLHLKLYKQTPIEIN